MPIPIPPADGHQGLRRSMYCLATAGSRYLIDLAATGPTFSHLASDALASRFAWISSARAAQALRDAQCSCPGVSLGLALLELNATGPGQWQVVSTRCWLPSTTPTPALIS